MPNLPLLAVWEKGVGGMRGKGARECRTSLIAPKNSSGVRCAPMVRPRANLRCARLRGALLVGRPRPSATDVPDVRYASVMRPRATGVPGVHCPPRPCSTPVIRRDHSGKRRCRLFPVGGWSAIAERQQLVNRLIDREFTR